MKETILGLIQENEMPSMIIQNQIMTLQMKLPIIQKSHLTTMLKFY